MKLSFCDFWGDFDYSNNFFIYYLKSLFGEVSLVDIKDADILIYSCFGSKHHSADRKRTKKIFFTGENIRPNFSECDYSFSFDFDDYDGKNIRIPLWYFYIDWFNVGTYGNPRYLLPLKEINGKWFNRVKDKQCCTVFSSPYKKRFEMIEAISSYMPVDCYGRPFGKHTEGEEKKKQKICQYKFNICFENTIHPGYVTEKLLHARTAGTVPLYYGHPSVEVDFNKRGFINLYEFSSINECAEYVNYVSKNENIYNEIINQPIFSSNFFEFDNKVKSIL